MTDGLIISRLETEVEATTAGHALRNLGVNGCRKTQSLTQMDLTASTLMFPIIGHKRVFVAQQTYEVAPGQVLLIPSGTRFDLENIPDRRPNRFLGASLAFDTDTLELFRKIYGADMQSWDLTPRWKIAGSDALFSSIVDWMAHDRQFSTRATQTRHRLAEILLLLADQGTAGNVLFAQKQGLREQTKHLFALNPGHDWRVDEITQRLATSESTLRRQLRAENTSFSRLLEDARLDRGVELVMMTDMPISQVAFDCGYQSQSRFSERFRLRFSLSPTQLRATQKQTDGDVVALDAYRGAG